VLAIVMVAAAACATPSSAPPPSSNADTILAPYDLARLDARAVIDRLDSLPVGSRPAELRASVRPGGLIVTDTRFGASATLDLPDDQFYLSVAPYLDRTHECFHHSLTTCRGELGGRDVHVTVTDRATGVTVVDQTVRTFDNGFTGFWLPAGIDATLRVDYDGRSATTDISTGPDDPTCLTTLRLA
jgi:hypothetical protein